MTDEYLKDYSLLDVHASHTLYIELKKHPPLSTTVCLWRMPDGKPCGKPKKHIHKGQAYCELHDPCNPVDEEVD